MIELAAEVPLPPPRYPGVAYALARYRARRIVESELRSQGIRVSYVPPRDIIAQAMEYLRNHPELLDQATESVRNDPKLRKIASGKIVSVCASGASSPVVAHSRAIG